MRKTIFLFVILGFVLATTWLSCATSESARAEKAARRALMKEKMADGLSRRHYTIDIDRAYPDGRSSVINLSSPYSVTVSGDTIISYLPFFGRAYSVPYGGGKGLNFTGRIRRYSESTTRKGEHLVNIDVESEEDTYVYYISLHEGGNATINVQPRQRSHIAFSGNYHFEE